MKFKVLFFIFTIINVITVTGQKSLEIIYKVPKVDFSYQKQNEKKISAYTQLVERKTNEYAQSMDFILKVNPNESYYYMADFLSPENWESNMVIMAKYLGAGFYKYYQSKSGNKILRQFKERGKWFIGVDSLNGDRNHWRITQITDTILGHKVIKAVNKDRPKLAVWFAPDLPVPFGPMGYGNLPGLILKKEIENMPTTVLVAQKIIYYNKPFKIKPFTKGKIESEADIRARNLRGAIEMQKRFGKH